MSKEVVKNKKFNKLNIKVNNLENQILDPSTLIQTNQYKICGITGLVSTAVLNTKIAEVKNKIPDVSGLVTTAVVNTKLEKLRRRYLVTVI